MLRLPVRILASSSRAGSASDGMLAMALQSVVLHHLPGDPVPGGGVGVHCLPGVPVLPDIDVLNLDPTNPGGGVWF